jgi:hypothetical protein
MFDGVRGRSLCHRRSRCVRRESPITSWNADLESMSEHKLARGQVRCKDKGENELKRTFIIVVGLSLKLPSAADLSLRLDRGDALDKSIDLIGDLVMLLEGVVHASPDVLVELLVGHVAKSQLAVDLLSLGRADDTAGDDDGDVADALHGRVEPVLLGLLGEKGGAEGFGRCVNHRLRDGDGLREDSAKAEPREDIFFRFISLNAKGDGVARCGMRGVALDHVVKP